MTAKTKAALSAEQAALYADNTLGQITAASQRTVTQDVIDSSGTLLDVNTFAAGVNSSSPTTGSIVVTAPGGVGIGGNLNVGGGIIAGASYQGSAVLSGTAQAPTQAPGDNSTSIATTAFVASAIVSSGVLTPSNVNPLVDGTAAPGVATAYSRGDHVHPTDTSRAPTASPTFTGTVTAPTVSPASDNTTKVATTAFVQSALGTISGVTSVSAGTGISTSGTTAVTVSMANMAASSLKGNNTGGVAAPADLTVAQVMTLLGAAPIASPTFTGTPASVTPAANDNTTKIATTAYVQGQGSNATPAMDGTAASGSALTWSRSDHVHPTDTTRMAVAGGQTTTGGFRITPYNGGTVSTGTYTPDAFNHNYQYYTNNGAHTLAAPANDCAIDILITNGATAGTITFSGFTVGPNVGDAMGQTNTSKFIISIRRINAISTYIIKALQ